MPVSTIFTKLFSYVLYFLLSIKIQVSEFQQVKWRKRISLKPRGTIQNWWWRRYRFFFRSYKLQRRKCGRQIQLCKFNVIAQIQIYIIIQKETGVHLFSVVSNVVDWQKLRWSLTFAFMVLMLVNDFFLVIVFFFLHFLFLWLGWTNGNHGNCWRFYHLIAYLLHCLSSCKIYIYM
jgi:hypothetical protein